MIARRGYPVLFIALCFGLGPILPAAAHTVSFLVIETGLNEESPARQASAVWENNLLDVFFEAGHIVSNAPILRLEAPPAADFPEEAREDFDEAALGGADFFVLALLDYRNGPGGGEDGPGEISLRVFRTGSRRLVYEQRYAGKPVLPAEEELSAAKSAARALLAHLR
jgi:hypothetical protein